MLNELINWYGSPEMGGVIPEGEAFQARRLRVLEPAEYLNLSRFNQSLYACALAALAPTTHNTIPQRFRIENDGAVRVFVDRKYVLPASDPEGRQAIISMGAVTEHLIQTYQTYGMDGEFVITRSNRDAFLPYADDGSEPVVELGVFNPQAGDGEVDLSKVEAMVHRKVHRGVYDERPLVDEIKDMLIAELQRFPSLQLHIIKSLMVKDRLGAFQAQALGHVLGNQLFREELGRFFRLNDDAESRVGMRGREFGRDDRTTLILKQGMLGEGEIDAMTLQGFARAEQDGLRSATAVICITGENQNLDSWVRAGMLYGKLILKLQLLGITHQMHAALTEISYFPIRLANLTLKSTILHCPRRELLSVFRIGVPVEAQPLYEKHASKKPVEELFV